VMIVQLVFISMKTNVLQVVQLDTLLTLSLILVMNVMNLVDVVLMLKNVLVALLLNYYI